MELHESLWREWSHGLTRWASQGGQSSAVVFSLGACETLLQREAFCEPCTMQSLAYSESSTGSENTNNVDRKRTGHEITAILASKARVSLLYSPTQNASEVNEVSKAHLWGFGLWILKGPENILLSRLWADKKIPHDILKKKIFKNYERKE